MIFLILTTLIFLAVFHELYWKKRNLPPGPTPLPVLGNLLSFSGPQQYEIFRKWKNEFGPVYTIWLSFQPMVVISDYAVLKETILKQGGLLADRFSFTGLQRFLRGGGYGLIFSNGDLWREQRRFAIHTLRDFGMGRNLMEERIMVEVDFLLERLAKQKTGIWMQNEFDIAVGSIINNILFGYRFDEARQEEMQEIKGLLRKVLVANQHPLFILAAVAPILRNLPFFKDAMETSKSRNTRIFEFIEAQIEARRKDIDYTNEGYSDLMECYLKHQKWNNEYDKPNGQFYSDAQLRNVAFDIWVAGLDTTTNTLNWAVCYILNHPEVQEKLHEELDRVIGSVRKVTTADKNSLPYLNAVVNESQRLANILPQNLQRVLVEDAVVGGYTLKAGTAVMPQISTVMLDEKIFPDPYTFNPSRFLNPDGSSKKIEELIPFSMGKRQCIGEGLARAELYLFLANIFQRFTLTADVMPSMEKAKGQVVTAKKYLCNVAERH